MSISEAVVLLGTYQEPTPVEVEWDGGPFIKTGTIHGFISAAEASKVVRTKYTITPTPAQQLRLTRMIENLEAMADHEGKAARLIQLKQQLKGEFDDSRK